jgi:hypothetical protein
MKMTDDNKEFIFNIFTRWLRDSNFMISEEKITVVTSEFYAKAYLQSDYEHTIELISSAGIETRFVLGTRLLVPGEQLEIYASLEPNEKLTLDDKMNLVIFPRHQSFIMRDKSAVLEKIISIDPKSIDAKQEVIQNVLSQLESAKTLEITLNDFFKLEEIIIITN